MTIKPRDTKAEDDRRDTMDAVAGIQGVMHELQLVAFHGAVNRYISTQQRVMIPHLCKMLEQQFDKFPTKE